MRMGAFKKRHGRNAGMPQKKMKKQNKIDRATVDISVFLYCCPEYGILRKIDVMCTRGQVYLTRV